MRERYCTEYMFVGAYGLMHAWAIIDRRQGYYAPIGYIPQGHDAQKIVDALNRLESVNVSIERTS